MRHLLSICFVFTFIQGYSQSDTVVSENLELFVKGDDWENRKFYKIGHSIPFTGFMVNYYPNTNQIENIIELKDGMYLTGEATDYYPNGLKKEVKSYTPTGELFGQYIKWYENGQKNTEGEYRNGKKNGNWTIWNDKGAIIKQEIFEDGVVKQ